MILLIVITTSNLSSVIAKSHASYPVETSVAKQDDELINKCSAESSAMDQAFSAYQSEFQAKVDKASQDEQKAISEEPKSDVRLLFKTEFKNTTIKLPVITVKNKDKEFKYKTPQVTMKRKDVIFDFVGSRMVPKKVGQRPEVTCGWKVTRVGLGVKTRTWVCKTTWKDIITDVPEVYKERKTISTDIPEIAMQETRTVLRIPEVKVSSRDLIMKLPQFKYVGFDINGGVPDAYPEESRKKAEESQSRLTEAIAKAQAEGQASVVPHINNFYTCLRDDLTTKRQALANLDAASIKQLEATLAFLDAQGAKDSDDSVEIKKQLDEMKSESLNKLKVFDDQIAKLIDDEKNLISNLTSPSDTQLETEEEAKQTTQSS